MTDADLLFDGHPFYLVILLILTWSIETESLGSHALTHQNW